MFFKQILTVNSSSKFENKFWKIFIKNLFLTLFQEMVENAQKKEHKILK